jgi:hypothetical protein
LNHVIGPTLTCLILSTGLSRSALHDRSTCKTSLGSSMESRGRRVAGRMAPLPRLNPVSPGVAPRRRRQGQMDGCRPRSASLALSGQRRNRSGTIAAGPGRNRRHSPPAAKPVGEIQGFNRLTSRRHGVSARDACLNIRSNLMFMHLTLTQ